MYDKLTKDQREFLKTLGWVPQAAKDGHPTRWVKLLDGKQIARESDHQWTTDLAAALK